MHCMATKQTVMTEETIIKLPNQQTAIQWTEYIAIGVAEGFYEVEEATTQHQIEAWAVIAKLKLHNHLQGWFGRTVNNLVNKGIIDWEGNINWDAIDWEEQVHDVSPEEVIDHEQV
jgi:hypothetical protein